MTNHQRGIIAVLSVWGIVGLVTWLIIYHFEAFTDLFMIALAGMMTFIIYMVAYDWKDSK